MSHNTSPTEGKLNTIDRCIEKQTGSEELEGPLDSHKAPEKRPEKTVSNHQVCEVAMSQYKCLSVAVTPATSQPRSTSEIRPSTSGFTCNIPSHSPIVMVSPYRHKEGSCPPVTFSKGLLISMDHHKHCLEIDLFRPASEPTVFPLQDLSPLCLYRDLRTLKITGMMQSYQPYIWLVLWLNPQLTDLALEMAGQAEPLDVKAIAKAQEYARCKPTMQEVAQGKTKTEVLEKFHIVNLSLTNFVVHDAPFQWFSDVTLQKVELH